MPKQSKQINKDDPEYLERRKRNNEAIRKSREKSKAKASETSEKVDYFKKDNKRLEDKISVLGQEMQFLKDIFLAHAGSPNSNKASQAAEGKVPWIIISQLEDNIFLSSVAADVANMKKQPDQENQDLIDSLLNDLDQPGPSSNNS